MTHRISDTFYDALNKLTPQEQKAVRAEATRPLELEIRSLRAALLLEMKRAQELGDLAEDMQSRIDELSEQIAKIGPSKWIS